MLIATLKRIAFFTLILACTLFAKAQQIHFIYLQTENAQPFYVKLNNKIVSSSSSGYLILSKLTEGEYKLNIGFPKNEFPEENFQIVVDKKNEGFLLKNFNEKGWGLFNMQTYGVVMGRGSNAVDTVSKNLQSDPFSKMLANVVKDSSILQKNEPEKKIIPVIKTDSVVAIVQPESLLLYPAKKLLSKTNKDGAEMIYIDSSQNGNDTIRIFIPGERVIVKADTVNKSIVQTDKPVEPSVSDSTFAKKDTTTMLNTLSTQDSLLMKDTTAANNSMPEQKVNNDTTTSIPPLVKENKSPFENRDSVIVKSDEETKKKNEEAKQPETIQQDSTVKEDIKPAETKKSDQVISPAIVKSTTANSDCKAFADNGDFLKLRKKMASENSDDNMIKAAKKVFHSKCFSTEQIKNLSFLFLTNESKYKFFDQSYAFVADSDKYYTLQSQLTDSYYLNRFKAMIRK